MNLGALVVALAGFCERIRDMFWEIWHRYVSVRAQGFMQG